MKAITTRYAGPTNHRGSRFIASAEGVSSVSIPYDYALDAYANHEKAAYALCRKYGWSGRLIGGGTKKGYVWVFAEAARDARRGRSRRYRRGRR